MAGIQNAVNAVKTLAAHGDYGATIDESWLLEVEDPLTPEELAKLKAIYAAMLAGFFRLATTGHEFLPRDRIFERFGNTVAGNYPEADPGFLRFANTFWTLKILAGDSWSDREKYPVQLLTQLEQQVASVFFPTPGPVAIPANERGQTQRELLEALAPEIDAELFIRHNPILQRDRKSESSGCGAVLLVGALGIPAFLWSISRLGL